MNYLTREPKGLIDVSKYEPAEILSGSKTFVMRVPSVRSHPNLHRLLTAKVLIEVGTLGSCANISLSRAADKLDKMFVGKTEDAI